MLRTRIAVVVFGCILLAGLLVGYRLHRANGDRAVQQFQALELRSADALAALLQSELAGAARTLRALTALPAASWPPSIERLLAAPRGCKDVSCFSGIAVLASDGTRRQSAGNAIDITASEVQATVAWAGDPANAGSIRTILTKTERPSVVLATPMPSQPDSGSPLILAAQISLDSVFARDLSAGRHTVVLAADGTVLFQSDHPETRLTNVYRRTDRCFTCHESFDHVERTLVAARGVSAYRQGGIDRVAATTPVTVEGERWVVSTSAPKEQALAAFAAESWPFAVITLVTVLFVAVGGVLAWRIARERIRSEAETLHKARLEQSHLELTALNTKLERAAREWRTTADTIDAALIVLEPAGTIQRMNLSAAATLPDALPLWLGRPSSRLAEHEPWNAALSLVRNSADLHTVQTDRVRDSAGRTWDLSCRAMPDQQRSAVLVMARDVTHLVDLQESVRRSETMAQLGAIVSGVAHEVRNPLFAISSLVDAWAVQSHRDPTPFVDALRSEVNRLRTLMVDLLEYGRPTKTTRQSQPLGQVIDAAVRACEHEAAARRVRVVAEPCGEAEVLMDPRRLERVFINLVQNAIQHSPEEAVVRVEATLPAHEPSHVVVSVRDSGPGFAPADLRRIFTPFFSRRPGGFGLGLAITERIVTEHGGQVAAANDPAGGAVMTVRLPVVDVRPSMAGREVERV